MRRLDGYKHLNEAIQQWTEFDTKLASILFYNCFFFIKNVFSRFLSLLLEVQ